MKLYKKITASLLAASISLAMTVSSLAFTLGKGAYTYAVKVENEAGEVVTTVAPGNDVYLSLYVYETANPTTTFTLAKGESCVDYGYIIPLNALDSKYAEADAMVFDDTEAVATSDGEGSLYIMNSVSAASADITIDPSIPVIRNKLTVTGTAIEDIAVEYYEENCSIAYHKVGSVIPNLEPTSFSVQEGSADVPATGITLDKEEVTLNVKGTSTLTATVDPSNTTDTVTWESSDTSVATVENGVVTAVAPGKATITATAGSVSDTCVVKVMPEKGNVIVDAVDGKVVIYADSKDASAIANDATFEIEYTGTNEDLKRADGTYKKAIKSTFGEILGGEIGEGKVTGKVHFGIKIPDTVPESDRAFFTINVK